MTLPFRVELPFKPVEPPDWLPQGHARMTRNHDAGPGQWHLMIEDIEIIASCERTLGNWIADQINAARGSQERSERALLKALLDRYGLPA